MYIKQSKRNSGVKTNEMKNSLEGLNSRSEDEEEIISKL